MLRGLTDGSSGFEGLIPLSESDVFAASWCCMNPERSKALLERILLMISSHCQLCRGCCGLYLIYSALPSLPPFSISDLEISLWFVYLPLCAYFLPATCLTPHLTCAYCNGNGSLVNPIRRLAFMSNQVFIISSGNLQRREKKFFCCCKKCLPRSASILLSNTCKPFLSPL